MDASYGPILLLAPILLVVAGYLLAWRSRSASLRSSGLWLVAAIIALVALFSSWWTLAMLYGVLFDSAPGEGRLTIAEILMSIAAVAFLLILPIGAWYLAIRFAKAAARKAPIVPANKLE